LLHIGNTFSENWSWIHTLSPRRPKAFNQYGHSQRVADPKILFWAKNGFTGFTVNGPAWMSMTGPAIQTMKKVKFHSSHRNRQV